MKVMMMAMIGVYSDGDDDGGNGCDNNDGDVKFNYPLIFWGVIQCSILCHCLYHNHQI
jgi:hypothetical protein